VDVDGGGLVISAKNVDLHLSVWPQEWLISQEIERFCKTVKRETTF